MGTPTFRTAAACLLASLAALGQNTAPADALQRDFLNPPLSARPRVWWHWMNGNVTKEGITLDLEAVKRAGLGGVQVFDAHLSTPVMVPKKAVYFTPEWLELLRHAAAECKRLGLEMTIHAAAGWSESGGPWVKPAQAMQKLVWSETRVSGPRHFQDKLSQPPAQFGPYGAVVGRKAADDPHYYADSAVVAFRSSGAPARATASTDLTGVAADKLVDGDPNTRVAIPAQPGWVQLDAGRPFTARALSLYAAVDFPAGELQASDDGRAFRTVAPLLPRSEKGRGVPRTIAFEPVTARYFRLVFKPAAGAKPTELGEIVMSAEPRVHRFEDKAGFSLSSSTRTLPPGPALPATAAVAGRDVIDLTGKMAPDGTLTWDAPAGEWTVLRLGHSPTGKQNAPAPPEGTGLEADKLSRPAIEAYFAGFMDPIARTLGPLVGKGLRYVLIDSWEADLQNWTPDFLVQFRQRRGYDPTPWLPALTGRVVESVEQSDRFLWDVRRTIADLVAENHYGTFQEQLHKRQMGLYSEAVGIGMPMTADQLQTKGHTDIPMGEFWMPKNEAENKVTPDCKEASSAGHIYGKSVIAAEAFTATPQIPAWGNGPYGLKARGDLHLAAGINRFVLHEYAHQPFRDKVPGFTLGPYGTQFGRNVTWWDQAGAFMRYLSRSQFLLQQGLPVNDVIYFYGEGAPAQSIPREQLEPVLPVGYDYDLMNAEVLLGRLTMKDGRMTLPEGVSYRVLVLPPGDALSPAVLRKVRDLAEGGATVVGPRPQRAPGLTGYPQSDAEVKKLAEELWGPCDGRTACEHAFGRGRVVVGKPLGDVLAAGGAPPDFSASSRDPEARLVYIHRRAGDADLYFVSNQRDRALDAEVTLRVAGKVPELWDPDSGRMAAAAVYTAAGDRTTIPLHLDPAGSVFLVFRRAGAPLAGEVLRDGSRVVPAASGDPVVEASAVGRGARLLAWQPGAYELRASDGRVLKARVAPLPEPLAVRGPWEVRFQPGRGAPEKISLDGLVSWSEHPDDDVRHFSGTATYTTTVNVPAALRAGTRVVLDLGAVKELAEVKLNGKPLGVLWRPPFRVDVTDQARAGANRLEVKVTNLWPNRLIGDAAKPEAQRLTWTTYQPYKADSPLLPSGLLGPVRLVAGRVVEAK